MNIEIKNLKYNKPTEPYDFKIDRTSPVGNPFYMNYESQRDKVCDQYEKWFQDMLSKLPSDKDFSEEFHLYFLKMFQAFEKYGKLRLFCWCAPKRCHGEIIKKFIETKYNKE